MWIEVFKFEIQYRLKRPDTYLFFLFLFLFSLIGVEFIFQGVELGLVKKNAPIVIAKTMGAITGLSMLIISIIMGIPIIRDYRYNIAPLIFINPISKRDYLIGKFLGAFTIQYFVFSALLWGMMLGEFMPWVNPEQYLDFQIENYLQAFLWVTMPILFFAAALFFVTGALSKNMLVIYTQGLIVFVIFLLTKAIHSEVLQAILDPFSLSTLSLANKSWSVLENNTLLIPYDGIMFWHKLFWFTVTLIVLAFGYQRFQMKTHIFSSGKSNRKNITPPSSTSFKGVLPELSLSFHLKAQFVQLIYFTRFHIYHILQQTLFWAITICSILIILINAVNLGTIYEVDSYPSTYLIVEELQEMSIYFFIAILLIYSGELIWKERKNNIHLIHDAAPYKNAINIGSKFIALNIIYILLFGVLILTGIFFQVSRGYFVFDLPVYITGFFLELFPFLALYSMAAFFFQALSNNKFIGMLATMAFFIISTVIGVFISDHVLLSFGGSPLAPYSEMNKYGHFLKPFLWIKAYWLSFGMFFLIIASIIIPRGIKTRLAKRWKSGIKETGSNFKRMSLIVLVIFTSLGSFIFYNTNILNEYWSQSKKEQLRAAYEKSLKPFEYIRQPKIKSTTLHIELYPSKRAYEIKGHYKLVNSHSSPIQKIHLQKRIATHIFLDTVYFNRPVKIDQHFEAFHYTIYEFEHPLQAGDSTILYFKQSAKSIGFENNNSDTKFLYNGTFFNNDELPGLGYNEKYELEDIDIRASYNLSPKKAKADINNENELLHARSGSDSDGLLLDVTIGTEAPQTAITSGNLVKRWNTDGRNYFHYKTENPIINFYSVVSADYKIKQDHCIPKGNQFEQTVELEIYYHKGHEYNLERMMTSMKNALDYFSKNFSPYPFDHLRIMEFPRYNAYAQSLPGAIPFSESLGFNLDINDEEDVDMVFFITAHEIAHQWWGIQLEAANVQGKNMILESLAQYSAMMVFQEKYPEKVSKYLSQQLEEYQTGQRKMKHKEPPLKFVADESSIYYAKGVINMYILQKHIGEDNVNLALRNFLQDWKTFNNPDKANRYATTEDLIGYLKAVTPSKKQWIITELFEEVHEPKLDF